jgi:thiamine kinase-like enzyme
VSKRYRYLKQGKFLLSLDQSILRVTRSVALGYERNKLSAIGIPKTLRQGSVRAITKDRLRLLNSRNVIELPAFGHIGMAVHRGYKVFDFEQHYVTKVFAPGTDPDAARLEIRASRYSSDIAAAPRFIEEGPGHEWYREEYICGVHATDPEVRSGKDVREYYPAIEDCLLDLVACRPPKFIDTIAHIDLYSDTSFRDRWVDAGQDEEQVNEIVSYVEELTDWLRKQPKPDRLQLVLTHGDFSLVNAIATDGGLRFIDWEGVTFGGLYNDVIHFLFAERYYDRIDESFIDEMTEFVSRYREAALDRFSELRESSELDFALARRLYYLERIGLMLNRSISSNLCNVVINSIATFRAYDQDAGDVAA